MGQVAIYLSPLVNLRPSTVSLWSIAHLCDSMLFFLYSSQCVIEPESPAVFVACGLCHLEPLCRRSSRYGDGDADVAVAVAGVSYVQCGTRARASPRAPPALAPAALLHHNLLRLDVLLHVGRGGRGRWARRGGPRARVASTARTRTGAGFRVDGRGRASERVVRPSPAPRRARVPHANALLSVVRNATQYSCTSLYLTCINVYLEVKRECNCDAYEGSCELRRGRIVEWLCVNSCKYCKFKS